eukprot:3134558-Rhodomonas_salina.1
MGFCHFEARFSPLGVNLATCDEVKRVPLAPLKRTRPSRYGAKCQALPSEDLKRGEEEERERASKEGVKE